MAEAAATAKEPEKKPKANLALPIDRWNKGHVKALAAADPDQLAETVMAIITKNTSALPGTAFVRRTNGEILKKHAIGVRLAEREGMIMPMRRKLPVTNQAGTGVDYVDGIGHDYTLDGLRHVNEMLGLQLIRPDTVTVDGQKQMNPYIVVDTATKQPEVVYARCLCVGRTKTGSLVATDAMVRLDLNIYLLENIQSKMKYLKNQAHKLGVYGPKDEKPKDDEGNERPGSWAWMPVHSVGGLGLWVNMADEAFSRIIGDHTTRLKFVERLAQSFAERNAIKAHPAMPAAIKAVNGVAVVSCVAWTTDFERNELDRLRELVESDRLHEFKTASGDVIDVQAVEVTELDEAAKQDLDTVTAENAAAAAKEDGDEEGDDAAGAAPAEEDDLLPKAAELFATLAEVVGTKGAKKAVQAAGDSPVLDEADPEQLRRFIEAAEAQIAGG